MAAVINPYYYNVYAQPSFYPHFTAPPVQQMQQPIKSVQYVETTLEQMPPRRQPRIYRQVILLPTPAPTYRQVRHRLPTPERKVIQRTVVQKSNGDVIVEQHTRPTTTSTNGKARAQSRQEISSQSRSSRHSRQVNTD